MDTLFDAERAPAGQRTSASGRRAPAGGAHAPAHARRVRRAVAPARRGLGAAHARSSRAGRTRWCSTARPGSGKTTLARLIAEHSQAAFEELSAVQAGRAEVRAVIERAAHRRAIAEPARPSADDPVPRRDPPLQQGPAGRAAAGRRGGPADADRRDHREPRVRGQRRAALAHARVRAAGAQRRGARRAAARALPRSAAVDDEAIEFLAARSEGDARTALNALELAVAHGRREPGEQRGA